MKWPCIVDAVVLIVFIVACIWEWRRDVNAKAREEAEKMYSESEYAKGAKAVNPYRVKLR